MNILKDTSVFLLTHSPADLALSQNELRIARRDLGERVALHLSSMLAGYPLTSLVWRRVNMYSKPHVYLTGVDSASPVTSLSISHDGPYLAVAFARGPKALELGMGVDILGIARASEVVQSMACGGLSLLGGSAVLESLPSVPPSVSSHPATLFAVRWTLMEAVLKARGEGLGNMRARQRALAEAQFLEGRGDAPCVWGHRVSGEPTSGERELASACRAAVKCCGDSVPYKILGFFSGEGWSAASLLVTHGGVGEAVLTVVSLAHREKF